MPRKSLGISAVAPACANSAAASLAVIRGRPQPIGCPESATPLPLYSVSKLSIPAFTTD
jgi:hypothetical protein